MLADWSSRMTISFAPAVATAADALWRRNGRANAATISTTAAVRSTSSAQWRMRRRRTDWYGMRRTNMSDGNSMTRLRSRWMRCTSTGMAIADNPTKKSGVKKDIGATHATPLLSDAYQAFPARQITEQRAVEWFGGVQQRVVDPVLREPGRQSVDVRANQRAILCGQRLGHDRDLLPA